MLPARSSQRHGARNPEEGLEQAKTLAVSLLFAYTKLYTVRSIKNLDTENILAVPKRSGPDQIVDQQPLRQTTGAALGLPFVAEVSIVKKSDI